MAARPFSVFRSPSASPSASASPSPGRALLAALVVLLTASPLAAQDAAHPGKPVYDKWKARIGADLVTAAEKAVAARK